MSMELVLMEQRDKARAEVERLKNHIPDVGKMVRPEPSRLEIAAMIYAAFAGAQCAKEKVNPTAYIALKCADELLAEAAKGGAK